MLRYAPWAAAGLLLLACDASPETTSTSDDDAGTGGQATDPNANADGDCMTDLEEAELGTDPNNVDSDLDGHPDCDEVLCASNPVDVNERCYACGWLHNDPGTLVSNGSTVGSTIANIAGPDQCGETVDLWDFYGSYFIIYATGAW